MQSKRAPDAPNRRTAYHDLAYQPLYNHMAAKQGRTSEKKSRMAKLTERHDDVTPRSFLSDQLNYPRTHMYADN
jgi:hypothetical protein